MNSRLYGFLVLSLLLLPEIAVGSGMTRRFVLAAGANSGGHERVTLRYAVSDAAQFGDVMVKMGGVEPADYLLLEDPNLLEVHGALDQMRRQVSTSLEDGGRTEVLFYYSGHADEEGLLLGEERLAYGQLREMMDEVPADVRITVLDACASGAITRIKGGQRRQAFLVDDSSDMQGYAFLTSSSADEAAQESDQIGSSFFTHYLVSGMRGAADVSGDGLVSLTEAYEFAFDETLASTTETRGGAQHPAYEIGLTGTGDVVMTDLREVSAALVLTEELNGRFYVRNTNRQLVVELFKPAGRTVELGLEPGSYSVYMTREEELFLGDSTLAEGDRVALVPTDFQMVERAPTTVRGERPGTEPDSGPAHPLSLAKRHRFELRIGYWDAADPREVPEECAAYVETNVEDLVAAFSYSYWMNENLAAAATFKALVVEAREGSGWPGECESAIVIPSAFFGLRLYPFATPDTPLRPYLEGSLGPVLRVNEEWDDELGQKRTTTDGSFGGYLGGGLDMQIGRHFMVGITMGYNFMDEFSEPLAGKSKYEGVEYGIGFGVLVGKGE
jgi:hypothetical protein